MLKYIPLVLLVLVVGCSPEGPDIAIDSDIAGSVDTDNQQNDAESDLADPIVVVPEGEN